MLSNFFRPMTADGVAPPRGELSCRAVRRHEINDAIRLILSNDGRLAGDSQVVDFLRYAVDRGIDLNDIWLVLRDQRIVWATLPVINPGRTMLLLMPDAPPAGDVEAVQTLLDTVCEHFAARGIAMTQALLEPSATVATTLSDACSFARLAELLYLQGDVRRAPAPAATLHLETYNSTTHDRFAAAVLASYEQSLDCPALNGVRDIEDILTGHKGTGDFASDLWLLASDDAGQPLAVLLLAPIAGAALELVYLGVCPAARGQGLATSLLRHAMSLARARGLQRLSLAVDSANVPALRLYYGHGMYRICSKIAMMRDLRHHRTKAHGFAMDDVPHGKAMGLSVTSNVDTR